MIKRLGKPILLLLLLLAARAVLRRYKPCIVMVTGSVGKTSTKDAVAAVLRTRYLVRKSDKSFNSEFGVPFTILGVENPWMNPIAWLALARRAFALIFLPNHYPNLLVLEVGADAPGDLAKILAIARPYAVVITRLPEIPVHVEFYASPEAVREEEFSPAEALPPAAPLVVSADDPYALDLAARVPASLATYGLGAKAGVRLSNVGFAKEGTRVVGMRAKVSVGEESGELAVRGSVGKTQILPAAAALAAAHAFDIPLGEALAALASYEPPAGRGRLFAGVRGATLIDESYNASPVAVEEALETLANYPRKKGAKRVAVLGDMLELGRYSVMEHERIGATLPGLADLLVTVGIRAKGFASAARAAGMPESAVHSFDDASAAAAALAPLIEAGDVVLIKGSQSIRMERIVAALLADPAEAARLPRQERAWLGRP